MKLGKVLSEYGHLGFIWVINNKFYQENAIPASVHSAEVYKCEYSDKYVYITIKMEE